MKNINPEKLILNNVHIGQKYRKNKKKKNRRIMSKCLKHGYPQGNFKVNCNFVNGNIRNEYKALLSVTNFFTVKNTLDQEDWLAVIT